MPSWVFFLFFFLAHSSKTWKRKVHSSITVPCPPEMPWNRAFWDGVNTTHHHQNHKDWLRLMTKVSGLKSSIFVTRKQHTYPKDKILRKSLAYGDVQEMFISSFYPTFYLKHTCNTHTVKRHESLHLMLPLYLPLSFSLTYSDLVPQLIAKSQKEAKIRK